MENPRQWFFQLLPILQVKGSLLTDFTNPRQYVNLTFHWHDFDRKFSIAWRGYVDLYIMCVCARACVRAYIINSDMTDRVFGDRWKRSKWWVNKLGRMMCYPESKHIIFKIFPPKLLQNTNSLINRLENCQNYMR